MSPYHNTSIGGLAFLSHQVNHQVVTNHLDPSQSKLRSEMHMARLHGARVRGEPGPPPRPCPHVHPSGCLPRVVSGFDESSSGRPPECRSSSLGATLQVSSWDH